MSFDADAGSGREPDHHRRPVGWIVVSCVLALAVVGLGIWAFNAQSDADDAQAKLVAQTQAAKSTPQPTAEPTSTPTPAPAATTAPVDPAIQEDFEQVADDLGATSESVDQIEQDLEQASAKVGDAEKARENASGAIDKAKAEAQELGARFELTRTCLRGTLSALGTAFESGGMDAVVQQLEKLSGSCASAASS
jgi:ABC-type transporter Mla subunit MlaD